MPEYFEYTWALYPNVNRALLISQLAAGSVGYPKKATRFFGSIKIRSAAKIRNAAFLSMFYTGYAPGTGLLQEYNSCCLLATETTESSGAKRPSSAPRGSCCATLLSILLFYALVPKASLMKLIWTNKWGDENTAPPKGGIPKF